MKLTVKKEEKFTPIHLSVTFENEKEYQLLKALFGCDKSVPELLVKQKDIIESDKILLSNLMGMLFERLDY